MVEILMPRLGANDNYIQLAQWLANNGDFVEKDSILAVLETTKETSDLIAPVSGYLYQMAIAGEEYGVNEKIACLCENANEMMAIEKTVADDIFAGYKITKKAEKIIREECIDISVFDRNELVTEKLLQDFMNANNTKALPVAEKSKADFVNSVVILCGGGLCKMSISAIRSVGSWNIYGILDNSLEKGSEVMGVKVIGSDSCLEDLFYSGYVYAVNALGAISTSNKVPLYFRRKELYDTAKAIGFAFPNIIHSSAFVDSSATLGEGNLVFANALIDCAAVIGNNTIINTGSIISHDCRIGDHTRISPSAVLAGGVAVGENSLIGMGVTVYMNIKIGKNVIISNGKHIFSNIPDDTVIV
ncbi:MAG: NeuD/PglB/VioB family sugar acetyltransferase [Lachnospiraceae bacterium]|jgi:UDP-perosamine 4-acetyltransferase|nr:NeuD/PglB/VioB family sugar acetyltransferase [Lachnospiraceae bacterium]